MYAHPVAVLIECGLSNHDRRRQKRTAVRARRTGAGSRLIITGDGEFRRRSCHDECHLGSRRRLLDADDRSDEEQAVSDGLDPSSGVACLSVVVWAHLRRPGRWH